MGREIPEAQLPIFRTMCLSTGHLPFEDFKLFELVSESELEIELTPTQVLGDLVVEKLGYGFRISVDPGAEVICSSPLSVAFWSLYSLAIQHECAWLEFDRDGPVIDGLPTFEW